MYDEGQDSPEFVTHQFWLRPDLRVRIVLPEDLTLVEASRLADAIKTFPIDPLDLFAIDFAGALSRRLDQIFT